MVKLFSYPDAENFIYNLVPSTFTGDYSKGYGLERIKYALNQLGNPQDKVKAIHMAGTSGKGSTVSFISRLLQEQGFKVGLTVSPHVLDIRERIQLNNKLIAKDLFAKYFSEIYPTLESTKQNGFGTLSYFETIITLAYYSFWKENVDYAVIETGLGGTLDATNVIHNPDKLNIIGKIGMDHVEILGGTLKEIAENKAGIMQKDQTVIYLNQPGTVNDVIVKRAKKKECDAYSHNPEHLIFRSFDLSSLPDFQRLNFSLAYRVYKFLSARDKFSIKTNDVQSVIDSFTILGRFDQKEYKGKKFILDGAHNPQKIQALVKSLVGKYENKKFIFIFASKQNKDYESMLKYLIPHAKKFIFTEFLVEQDVLHKSASARELGIILERLRFSNYLITQNVAEALKDASELNSEPIVITGSFFLLGGFYKLLDQ